MRSVAVAYTYRHSKLDTSDIRQGEVWTDKQAERESALQDWEWLHISHTMPLEGCAEHLHHFIKRHEIEVLNVAGHGIKGAGGWSVCACGVGCCAGGERVKRGAASASCHPTLKSLEMV